MPKQAHVTIISSIEENGDVFHELTFADGHKDVVKIPHDTSLLRKFVEAASKAKLLSAANAGKDAADSARKDRDWPAHIRELNPKSAATAVWAAAVAAA